MAMPDLDADGYDFAGAVLTAAAGAALARVFDERVADTPGTRDGLDHPAIRDLARSPAVRALVEPVLGERAFAHRATLFDKTPTANWLVAWHQDLVVPVRERRDVPGFGPLSQKRGTWFVQPPIGVLQRLLAIRIDLDGSDATNGALRVLPGSHRDGVLLPAQIAALAARTAAVPCAVPAGGALRMRPLLLHASSRAVQPTHRRIVHLEFAPGPLADGIEFQATGGH